jgi:hypothetical protein
VDAGAAMLGELLFTAALFSDALIEEQPESANINTTSTNPIAFVMSFFLSRTLVVYVHDLSINCGNWIVPHQCPAP